MKKVLSTAYKHIRRSPYQALSAILVLTLAFFIASIFLLIMVGSERILTYFETRPQVTVFFQDEVTEEQIQSLKEELENTVGVTKVTFISKEQALEIYREQNKDDPLLLEMVTAEILPASFEISAQDISFLPEIAESLVGKQGVEEVIFQEDVIEALTTWTRALRIAGIAMLGFLGVTSILIIVIIIGLRISARRREIDILRLLGATNWYISGPFLIEGIFYGVLGAILAWGTTYVVLLYATPFLVSFLGDIPLLPVPLLFMLALLVGMASVGTLIGSFASLLAVRRFLR